MFPKEGQKVPEIRFKGFDGDWEESLFENNFETSIKTNTLARVFLSVSEGEVLNIHYGDILIKFNSLLDLSKVDLPHIYNSKTFEYNNFLQNGDVIFADTAEDITAGKAIEIIDINNKKIVSGLHTIACHPRKSFGVGFWGYYLNSYSFHNHIIPLLQGIKVLSLNKSKLANLKVIIPKDAKEQHAIGDFFLNIDNLINNQQYKIESIQKIKQSFLSKMFV
jgi:type I restriction enzyme S subunit